PEPLDGYAQWLLEQMRSGLHVAIFGNPGLSPAGPEARTLGLSWVAASSFEPTHVVSSDRMVDFEAAVPARPFDGPLLALRSPGAGLHLELADASGRRGVAVATTEWGGLASSHVLALRGLEGSRAWVLDPFEFLSEALALPPVPEPDLTTENGRRVALFVIRASGLSWPARAPGAPATFRALRDQILARYPWPHALDLAPTAGSAPSREDLAAARQLLERPQSSRAIELEPGTASLRREHASLTELEPAAREGDHGLALLGPVAWDLSYLAPHLDEAFPFARVRETLEYTEHPRRLTPILLDYHGFLAASSGGLATLDALYRYVEAREPYFLTLEQYRARVEAFRQQVVTRQLDGSLRYHGGEMLSTLRIPPLFGTPDLQRSRGVVALRQIPQAVYASFGPGTERVLVPGRGQTEWPHLTDTNARILASSAAVGEAPAEGADMNRIIERLDFELDGALPVQIGFGGLGADARCRLLAGRTLREGVADHAGEWRVSLPHRAHGVLHLSCTRSVELARREPS
ncbi:MAG TPA: hypothetical protein VG963_17685, partial [Polyangiaceae bacterium]|nr:hypothetical protein [Polyangiaceae bacterium]